MTLEENFCIQEIAQAIHRNPEKDIVNVSIRQGQALLANMWHLKIDKTKLPLTIQRLSCENQRRWIVSKLARYYNVRFFSPKDSHHQ